MTAGAQYWIKKLNLKKHPEGGYYKETYRSPERIRREHLPGRFRKDHCFSTAIYYLLPGTEFSAFHRIRSDEIWHFYHGSPLILYSIDREGMLFEIKLGQNLEKGQLFQARIPAGNWFAARVMFEDDFSLVGCTVAPGFEYEDFELGDRKTLLQLFPRHKEIIKALTR
ncbi:MAG TPA: cupin domain-containing protein [Caldithrix abyssi]|uniref:Cupin domain-containing protein n=1 Tax=Caldithrix abyssi TaxID=187145 RepID=A0A7V4UDX3_CALAY|nr:cupin domain-containing protein [Caldithrix abyssi]